MKCINFDRHFMEYTAKWADDHKDDYKNIEQMEADMPAVYIQFLNSPASWLDGLTPSSYFTQYDDPKVLVDWLNEYCKQQVPVPDLLQDRIIEVGLPCEKRLLALLQDEGARSDAKMTAIGLLREMESTTPMKLYIAWQRTRLAEDELAENAMDSLRAMGKEAFRPMLHALREANKAGQEALLDALVEYPGEEEVFRLTLAFFNEDKKRRALFAGYLAKLNDMRALPDLKAAAEEEDLPYLDYIEIRNAIESLGGDCPEREYDSDADYDALSMME